MKNKDKPDKGTGHTLEEWREIIGREVGRVDKAPYSHNIISIALGAIGKNWGKDEANKAIVNFGLEKKGWQQVK